VFRANNKARWNFKNDENKTKYNLNNRNKNTPVIRKNVNLNASALYGNGPNYKGLFNRTIAK
jgi:hypothetical protein